jgi:N-acetylglucosamine-6-phosphate deacetylase
VRLGVAAALVGGELVDGDVEVIDGRVAAVGVGAPSGSRIAAPGFVDLQVNGYAGVDFSVPGDDGYEIAGAALLAGGVTACQPTLVTAAVDSMLAALARMPAAAPGPRVIGAHLEGPFISPARPGAHDPGAIRSPDLATLEALVATAGLDSRRPVSQVTLAPELPGAPGLIDALVARGITVSLGHTEADAATAHLAFDRGASAVTHLFNAMRRPEPRDPGLAFAALGRGDVFVTLVVDGHHLADDTVRIAWRAAGGRVVLISDAVAAAGAPDGDYTLGGAVPIRSEGGTVRTADGLLAAALRAATEAPARLARRPDLGRLEPGARADLVVLDDSLAVRRVLLDGDPVA